MSTLLLWMTARGADGNGFDFCFVVIIAVGRGGQRLLPLAAAAMLPVFANEAMGVAAATGGIDIGSEALAFGHATGEARNLVRVGWGSVAVAGRRFSLGSRAGGWGGWGLLGFGRHCLVVGAGYPSMLLADGRRCIVAMTVAAGMTLIVEVRTCIRFGPRAGMEGTLAVLAAIVGGGERCSCAG